jgi:hypothetical protein
MSDIVNLINKSNPIPIKYVKNICGFSDSNGNINKYHFELIINGLIIGEKYFSNLEESKYSHLIQIKDKIKLSDINTYKASITIYSTDIPISCKLEGKINQNESCSTQRTNNIYVEFSRNDVGYTICSCFYTGQDYTKIFASPPN